MSLNFDCPYCHRKLNLLELQTDSDLRAIFQILSAFGQYGHVVLGYCYLFGVSPMKTKAKKLRILLAEMKVLFENEEFRYQKRLYRISRAGIAEALNVVVKRHFADNLDGHNYLKKVMIGIAEQEEKDRSIKAEAELRRKEAVLGAGRDAADEEPDPRGGEIPPEAKADIARLFGPDKVLP